ncbi:hypothetical protein BDW59DRAFT_175365 [Aspergillus cavernicola]|uniref:Zn(2)-C6 fungal-type domain-containing protein n=1 Tax=Aspergillus cavernicola TaxID=176166 RepID=A0ABR4HQH0_9EURO
MRHPPRSRASTHYNFQRAYKACIPCRRRKVKCELESDLHEPCKRCRKMSLECRFSTKQPWSRGEEGRGNSNQPGIEENHDDDDDEHGQSQSVSLGFDRQEVSQGSAVATGMTEGKVSSPAGVEDYGGRYISTTMLQKQVASGNDALDILFDAAAAQANSGLEVCQEQTASPFDGCRFVKMGWFTAQEALLYTDWQLARIYIHSTRRSDRMSWMLVSSVLALAHELDIFESRDYTSIARGQGQISGPDVENYLQDLKLRRQRLPSLLFVIVNLLSSRIGCTSLMPDDFKQSNLDRVFLVDPDWARFMVSWVDLTRLTRTLRETFFSAAKGDNQCIDFEPLERWKSQLVAWKDTHQEVQNSRYENILHIEYEYLRVFANSIGVQGIVEQVLSDTLPQGTIDATFVPQARQLNMNRNEYEFIEEVIDGACVILAQIVSFSHPKCLPMRVLSRMISSSIFLLKALALGVRKTKLQESLRLLDAAIAALLSNQLDDIHLVSRYAALLETHVSRLRQTFASSGRVEGQNDRLNQTETHNVDAPEHLLQTEGSTWDPSMMNWSDQFDLGDWLSLPLDPLMAPFGSWEGGPADLGLDADCLDLDFIWNLPP